MTEASFTEDQRNQLRALDGLRDEDIDLSDIPEQGHRTDWVRGPMLESDSSFLNAVEEGRAAARHGELMDHDEVVEILERMFR
jgi:hypothetical protein